MSSSTDFLCLLAIIVSEFGFLPFMESSQVSGRNKRKTPKYQIRMTHLLTPPRNKKPIEAQRYDLERSLYYKYFLSEMLKSIYEDGVNIVGALAWTIQ